MYLKRRLAYFNGAASQQVETAPFLAPGNPFVFCSAGRWAVSVTTLGLSRREPRDKSGLFLSFWSGYELGNSGARQAA